jgi:hypothetical protein
MMEPHYRLDERLPAMGLAFLLDDFDGHTVAGHDGGWPGFVASMLLSPSDGVGVVAFVNATSKAAHEVADKAMRRMLALPDPASRLPREGVLELPHLWPELVGFYGPEGPLNTNSRIWLAYAGEIEVHVKDKHLQVRALAGPLRRGVRLYPTDPADPLAFEALVEGQAQPVVFGREANSGRVDRLCVGFDPLRKRPGARSLRVKGVAALGTAAGAGLAALLLMRAPLRARARG